MQGSTQPSEPTGKKDRLKKEPSPLEDWVYAFEDIADTPKKCCHDPFKPLIKSSQRQLNKLLASYKRNTEEYSAATAQLTPQVYAIATQTTHPWALRQAAFTLLSDTLDAKNKHQYQEMLAKAQTIMDAKRQRRWALGSVIFSGVMVCINGLVSAIQDEEDKTMAITGILTTLATTIFGGVMTYQTGTQLNQRIEEQTQPTPMQALCSASTTVSLKIQGDHNSQNSHTTNHTMKNVSLGDHNEHVSLVQGVEKLVIE